MQNNAIKERHPGEIGPAAEVRHIMSVYQVAEYLSMGHSKIYMLINQRKIPHSRIGRLYRFVKEDIDKWFVDNLIYKGKEAKNNLQKEGGDSMFDDEKKPTEGTEKPSEEQKPATEGQSAPAGGDAKPPAEGESKPPLTK